MNLSVVHLSHRKSTDQPQLLLTELCGSERIFRDRYRVIRALGRGGFGVTFLAQDVALPGEPECVIKQLSPKTTNPAVIRKASERFEREAKILAQLGSHAQIPRLLDYFEIEGSFYLVQEYVSGLNLAKEVRQNGPLSELGVKRFLKELLPVLEYVHQNQVIHRDIKPPNIIRCQDDGRLVLIDFGAVKEEIAEFGCTSQKVPTTQFVGTVGFAPPEQLALRPLYCSDIYAIGVTCLYLLTAKPPMDFEIDSRTGEILWEEFVDVSEHFGKILRKMLKISPRDRYQSVDQVLRALELEPYLDNLADCLHRQPSALAGEAIANQEDDSNIYLTPIARTAKGIRSWRKRLHDKQQRNWSHENLLMTSDCCG
jgi:serine/threonine-protein kinase